MPSVPPEGDRALPTPILYGLGRVISRLGTRVYFREVQIGRVERVPLAGPVILAANHPQSITDALILGLASPRVVHYLAHSGLFANPVQALLLRGAGVIPIHRRDDVTDAAARNEASFESCCELLHEGGCVGIFPEGTSQQARRVQPLKTGTARIALEAESQRDFGLGLSIVPVGLSFQSRRRFRSRVLVRFGKPIVVADHRELFERDPQEAARVITADLQNAIRHQVIEVSRSELEEFVQRVERVYKHELRERPELTVPGLSRFERDQFLAREIARATDYFYENRPEAIWGMAELLDEYQRKLDHLGIADRMLREESPTFAGAAMRLAILGILGLPIAAWGLLTGYLPYRLTNWITRLIGPDATKTHTTQFAVGGVVFGGFYVAYIWWALGHFGAWTTVAIGISLPVSGLFAGAYVAALLRRRKHLRFAYLRSTHGLMIQKLRTFRREIIEVMDEALEEYVGRERSTKSEGTES
jgi:1-acyl-sn-glycerol-3-phosphate acyltransferase